LSWACRLIGGDDVIILHNVGRDTKIVVTSVLLRPQGHLDTDNYPVGSSDETSRPRGKTPAPGTRPALINTGYRSATRPIVRPC
jgi:hypothetical protein